MTQVFHAISEADKATMAVMREHLKAAPDTSLNPAMRPFFDQMISQFPIADNVECSEDILGGVPGWWSHPKGAPDDAVILYFHGGGYVAGSAKAYCGPVSQFAAVSGVRAFAAEYALAPERPFPAAFENGLAVYDALVASGYKRIAIAGDSAGGGLTLALTIAASAERVVKPVAAVAISPWADLTVSGASMETRVHADPFLNRAKALEGAGYYLAGADARDPRASPVFGPFANLPPVLIHVGDDEVLLDDAVRFADGVDQAGGTATCHVWEGMLHVFTSNLAMFEAARTATADIGAFLSSHLKG